MARCTQLRAAADQEILLLDWCERYRGREGVFVADGIINQARWYAAIPRVLFIGKDPNAKGGRIEKSGPDLRILFGSPQDHIEHSKFFEETLGTWAHGLMQVAKGRDADYASSKLQHDSIRSAAVINLRKLGGVGISKTHEIRHSALEDKEYIGKQVKLISPDVLVCCGILKKELRIATTKVFPHLTSLQDDGDWLVHESQLWIKQRHPVRGQPAEMFGKIISAYKEAIAAGWRPQSIRHD